MTAVTASVSVVVPVRNGMPWLDDQLAALVAQEVDLAWEIVIVDNGSTDGSLACAHRWASRNGTIRVFEAPNAHGASGARNVGASVAAGSYLLFCDADDVVQPGWIAACTRALNRSDVVAGSFDFGSLRGRPSEPTPAATRQLNFLPAALGANVAVRRVAFEAVGGFTEDLRVGEDIDFSWRLQLRGFRFVIARDAVVAKREHKDASSTFRGALAYGRSGAMLFHRFRSAGMRRDLWGALKSWTWLVLHVPGLVDPLDRQRWVRAVGMRIGRLLGSLQTGTFFP